MKWHAAFWTIAFTSAIGSIALAQSERADGEGSLNTDEARASRALARALGQQGVAAYKSGDFTVANEKLSRAFAILRAPTLALWWARTLRRQSKYLRAAEIYLEAMRSEPNVGTEAVQIRAQALAAREREELLAEIPQITLEFGGKPPNDLVVELDGIPVAKSELSSPQLLDPGEHRVVARSKSRVTSLDLALEPGTQQIVPLRLGALPAPASTPSPREPVERSRPHEIGAGSRPPVSTALSTRRAGWTTASWISLGIGGTALAFSGVVSLLALPKLRDLDQRCADHVCGSNDQQALDEYRQLRLLSRIGFIAGTIGVTTAGYLYVVAPSARANRQRGLSTNLRIGAGTLGFDGVF